MARDPHHVETFNAAMRDLTRLTLPGVLAAYDFSGLSRLIDVGEAGLRIARIIPAGRFSLIESLAA